MINLEQMKQTWIFIVESQVKILLCMLVPWMEETAKTELPLIINEVW